MLWLWHGFSICLDIEFYKKRSSQPTHYKSASVEKLRDMSSDEQLGLKQAMRKYNNSQNMVWEIRSTTSVIHDHHFSEIQAGTFWPPLSDLSFFQLDDWHAAGFLWGTQTKVALPLVISDKHCWTLLISKYFGAGTAKTNVDEVKATIKVVHLIEVVRIKSFIGDIVKISIL